MSDTRPTATRRRPTRQTDTPWRGVFWMVAAFAAVPGFFVHGWFRMISCEVGFHPAADAAFAIAGVLASLALIGLPVGLPCLWIDENKWPGAKWLGGVALGALAGCAFSETVMLVDEAAFVSEARDRGADKPYWRDRAGPWTSASLVWRSGEGAHATD